ncbi:hypothetical protein G7Y89_g14544 [Cudoniella acicularis]|uniref:Fungal N-terminal domain-containing protein n=1 Tax=Cudoniella acicularis TaxID=354080 RepID=A0A8H4R1L4_9HELO|nr:hypothetical protein G7Y89_g14544 [Cudoniella acicularis]
MLIQLAHNTYRNCQKVGEEYREIAYEFRSLRAVLKTLRAEVTKPNSNILKRSPVSKSQLGATVQGYEDALDSLGSMLEKYEGLGVDGRVSTGKRLWQRFRFGSKIKELGFVREKIITHTAAISVVINTIQLCAADRVETKIDKGFAEVVSHYEKLQREMFAMASSARSRERMGVTRYSLSLSNLATPGFAP